MNICLCWVTGHRDIRGKADELAREGTTTDPHSSYNGYTIDPCQHLNLDLKHTVLKKPS